MIEAVSSVYRKYFDFGGRASRAEYWWFWLFGLLVELLVLIALRGGGGAGFELLLVFGVFNFIPSLTVLIRRLHDTDHSGWWILISLIPFIGSIWLFILTLLGGTEGPNGYGPKPAH